MKVRVTVVLEKKVESLEEGVAAIKAIASGAEALATVKKWKEQVVSK